MTSSTQLSNPTVPDGSPSRGKKKMKIQSGGIPNNNNPPKNSSIEWKSESQQEIYSSKLLQALSHSRLGAGGAAASPKGVHETADRVLAAIARGRTRWSRAILTNRLNLKFMKKNSISKRQRKMITSINPAQKKLKMKTVHLKSQPLPAFQRKGRFLGRLVPGCRKQPLPVVLDEATDYIAALEMQVRAMSALVNLLSASGSSSATVPMGRLHQPDPNSGSGQPTLC